MAMIEKKQVLPCTTKMSSPQRLLFSGSFGAIFDVVLFWLLVVGIFFAGIFSVENPIQGFGAFVVYCLGLGVLEAEHYS